MGVRLEGVRLYSSLLPVRESRLEPLPPLELATRGRQRRDFNKRSPEEVKQTNCLKLGLIKNQVKFNNEDAFLPAVPKPPSVAPRVAPREEEAGWLKPREAEPGPG